MPGGPAVQLLLRRLGIRITRGARFRGGPRWRPGYSVTSSTRMVPATVRWVPPTFARGASQRRNTSVMLPFAIPSAVSRFSGAQPTYDHPVADRYGTDILANNPHRKPRSTEQPVEIGMVVEDAQTGYVGAVVRIEYGRMELEDRNGRRKPFPIDPDT